jgi:DNA-binding XRE family transcriptional regulator
MDKILLIKKSYNWIANQDENGAIISDGDIDIASEFIAEFIQNLIDNGVLAEPSNDNEIMPPYIEIDLKKMRKDKNLTLREVAKKIGISFSHINKIETGKIEKPGYDIVVSLYNFYRNI